MKRPQRHIQTNHSPRVARYAGLFASDDLLSPSGDDGRLFPPPRVAFCNVARGPLHAVSRVFRNAPPGALYDGSLS
jgi:hypothetical protein